MPVWDANSESKEMIKYIHAYTFWNFQTKVTKTHAYILKSFYALEEWKWVHFFKRREWEWKKEKLD